MLSECPHVTCVLHGQTLECTVRNGVHKKVGGLVICGVLCCDVCLHAAQHSLEHLCLVEF